eukprot:Plantae.Rhodophyta-Purpureofilum_apyrenoidigerum.ctg1612.p1 GENE.Plantae.Rhodophyta-Purpureofilum_apyrenoidigerum.ctg1612~~Plantae.Rhodophyta-Purpureofilum_apyrenoidigerum.ctg1612.p1  ORF type:complete len:357 (+),score=56.08 Plantae.Rhodophyta-Purpureofilum_apyrenoidigerum.ctg1612:182-1252(+)
MSEERTLNLYVQGMADFNVGDEKEAQLEERETVGREATSGIDSVGCAALVRTEEEDGSHVAPDDDSEHSETSGAPQSEDQHTCTSDDTVDQLSRDIRNLIELVEKKSMLRDSSASFMRDHLRTILAKSSYRAGCENKPRQAETSSIDFLADSLINKILDMLAPRDLARFGGVSKKWYERTRQPELWKRHCLDKFPVLEKDEALFELFGADPTTDRKWQMVYPSLLKAPVWRFALHKPGKRVCNLVARVVNRLDIPQRSCPNKLTVERRFDQKHLVEFVLEATYVLHFEPETAEDVEGYRSFISYLTLRTRAGLAASDTVRYIFIPPCDYTRESLKYNGTGLMGLILSVPPASQTLI